VSAELAKALVGYSNIQDIINKKTEELEDIQQKIEQYPELSDLDFDLKETTYRAKRIIEKSLERAKINCL
jgi:hypothetical protein